MRFTVSAASPDELAAACGVLFRARADRCRDMFASGELDPAGLFAARDGRGTVRGAVLVQPLPGALGLAWPPRADAGRDRAAVEDALLAAACGWLRSRGVKVCQVFAADDDGFAPLLRHGFRHVTQVIHMRREVAAGDHGAGPPALTVRPAVDSPEVFADTLMTTYLGSLDCPELTGARTAADVLAGHRPAAGVPADRFQFLATHDGEPVGVVLFDVGTEPGALELSYLGLVPAARGRGLGGELVRFAVRHAAADGCRTLTLSVDARNALAVRLYRRHGFREYDRREVLLAAWPAPSEPEA